MKIQETISDLNTRQILTSTKPRAHQIPTLISMVPKPYIGEDCQSISYCELTTILSHYFPLLQVMSHVESLWIPILCLNLEDYKELIVRTTSFSVQLHSVSTSHHATSLHASKSHELPDRTHVSRDSTVKKPKDHALDLFP